MADVCITRHGPTGAIMKSSAVIISCHKPAPMPMMMTAGMWQLVMGAGMWLLMIAANYIMMMVAGLW